MSPFEKQPIEKEKPRIEIDPHFKKRLETIAQVIGGDFGMKVEIGKPGEGSNFNSQEVKIALDPLKIIEDPDLAIQIAGHEGEHRAITRSPQQIGVKPEKIGELYSKIGFRYLNNVIEDLAVDDWGRKRFPGMEPYTKKFYDRVFKGIEKKGRGVFVSPEVARMIAQLGYVPKFAQYGTEIARKWHTGKYSETVDPEVKKVLDKTIDKAQESWSTIPSIEKKEIEILKKARERFLITAGDIWPEVQDLVEKDLNQETLRQMIKTIAPEVFNQLPQNLKDSIKEKIEEAQKQLQEFKKEVFDSKKKEISDLEKEIKELQEQKEKASQSEKEKLTNEIEKKQLQKERKEKEIEEMKKEFKENQEKFGSPIPFQEFNKKELEALKEILKNLPEYQKENLKKEAEKNLKDLEDKTSQEQEGKLQESRPPSHQKLEEEREKIEKLKKEKEELEKTRKALKERAEKLKSTYDKYYEKVVDLVDDLYGKLERIFLPERRPRWKKGFPSGTRLDLLKAMKFEVARELGIPSNAYREMFERKSMPEKRDYKFAFLIDMSSSMEGEKIEEAFKGLIVLAEALNRLGDIDFAIYGFSDKFKDNIKRYKSFDEEFNEKIRNKLTDILNAEGRTPTPSATKFISEKLEENKGRNNFLITLTDGEPTEEGLKELTSKITAETNQKLVGLGLGSGTEFVEDFYPASLSGIKIEKLPETLAELFEDMILYPEKYK